MARVWVLSNRGGLDTGWAEGLARGMRPVDTQKSMVAAPRPSRFGPRVEPSAPSPWQLEQFSANRVRPRGTSRRGTGTVGSVWLAGWPLGAVVGAAAASVGDGEAGAGAAAP